MGLAICNRCRQGAPAFQGVVYTDKKVYQRWVCECGQEERVVIDPLKWDIDDPRAVRSMLLTRDYGLRIGLYDRGDARGMHPHEVI